MLTFSYHLYCISIPRCPFSQSVCVNIEPVKGFPMVSLYCIKYLLNSTLFHGFNSQRYIPHTDFICRRSMTTGEMERLVVVFQEYWFKCANVSFSPNNPQIRSFFLHNTIIIRRHIQARTSHAVCEVSHLTSSDGDTSSPSVASPPVLSASGHQSRHG